MVLLLSATVYIYIYIYIYIQSRLEAYAVLKQRLRRNAPRFR